jgi:hypothetical protein
MGEEGQSEPEESLFYPEDGGYGFLHNIGAFIPDYITLHPRRMQCLYSPP